MDFLHIFAHSVTLQYLLCKVLSSNHDNQTQMTSRLPWIFFIRKQQDHWPIRRPACRHAMTAANTVARSSGAVFLVRKPKIAEPAPVPMPADHTCFMRNLQCWNTKVGKSKSKRISNDCCNKTPFHLPNLRVTSPPISFSNCDQWAEISGSYGEEMHSAFK